MIEKSAHARKPFWRRLAAARRGAVSIIFAAAAVPMIAVVGLAIDYGFWNETNASLQLAADTAALNAVKIAAQGEIDPEQNYLYLGYVSGMLWFNSVGGYANMANVTPTVTVTGTSTITATVTYTGNVPSIFGGFLYKIMSYPLYGQSVASITTAPYLNVEILLDNSPSMDIGATPSDIASLTTISPCDVSNMWSETVNGVPGLYSNPSHQNYGNYQCSVSGGAGGGVYNTVAGGLSCPFPFPASQGLNTTWSGTKATGTPITALPYIATDATVNNLLFLGNMFDPLATFYPGKGASTGTGPFTCQGAVGVTKQADGTYPFPGGPCAFACHWDNSKTAGSGTDLWAAARKSALKPVLRFDSVKTATNTILKTMNGDNLAFNNLNVGVFTFSSPTNLDNTATVSEVYPEGCNSGGGANPITCEAGSNYAAAIADVGLPPTYPATNDTGIQPAVGGLGLGGTSNDDTDFPDSMTSLSTKYLPTNSGSGVTASSPKKVLFIISDGMEDYLLGYEKERAAFDYSYCNLFKNKGYTIYVIYTPYYPLMDDFYLTYLIPTAEGSSTTPGSLSYNLQACASSPSDYISAASTTDLQNALNNFLKAALTAAARFST
jgi:Flp pilus assembly protein TadG